MKSGESGLTSSSPGFTASALKAALIANEFTALVTNPFLADKDRFGKHFTDKGTLLDISQVCLLVYVYSNTCMYIYTHVCMHTNICVCIYIYMYKHVCIQYIYI